jgi:hypothetical protein
MSMTGNNNACMLILDSTTPFPGKQQNIEQSSKLNLWMNIKLVHINTSQDTIFAS